MKELALIIILAFFAFVFMNYLNVFDVGFIDKNILLAIIIILILMAILALTL